VAVDALAEPLRYRGTDVFRVLYVSCHPAVCCRRYVVLQRTEWLTITHLRRRPPNRSCLRNESPSSWTAPSILDRLRRPGTAAAVATFPWMTTLCPLRSPRRYSSAPLCPVLAALSANAPPFTKCTGRATMTTGSDIHTCA